MHRSVWIIVLAAILAFSGFPADETSYGQPESRIAVGSGDPAGITDGEMQRYGMNRYSPDDSIRTDTDGYAVNNYRAYAANGQGPGWGWLGLLGLFGLTGLFGRRGGRDRV